MTAREHGARGGQRGTTRVPLRVLVVEDSEADALLLVHELRRGGYEPIYRRVDTPEAMEEALGDATSWDVVVSDYHMPRFEAPEALKILRRQGYDTPFIIISGRIGEDVAVEAMKAGAHDYIMKDNMTRLCATIERGLEEAEARRERKQAEEALRASEASYRAIFDSSNDAIFMHDLETGAILDVNQKACAILGYSRKELRQRHLGDFSAGEPPYTAENALRHFRKAAEGEPQVFEWLSKNRFGRLFWSEVTLNRAMIGGHERLLANVRDITERKEAEKALRRAHDELEARVVERTAKWAAANSALQVEVAEHEQTEQELLQKTSELQAVFQALPDLYFRLDSEGTILDYQAGRDSNSYVAPQEFLGKRMQDVLPREVDRQFEEALRQVAVKDESACIEYSLALPEGDRNFEARLVRLRGEQTITIVRDITDRKQAEAELQRREEHFRSLIENASDIITILDGQGIIHYQSPAAPRTTGRSNEETIGKSAFAYFHPEDIAHTVATLAEVVNNPGTTHSVEYRFRHRDGYYMTFESVGRTLLPDSAAAGVVVTRVTSPGASRQRKSSGRRKRRPRRPTAPRASSSLA